MTAPLDDDSPLSNSSPERQRLLRTRAKAALVNLFVGDALSMPVHWFYNPGDIIRQFPPHGIQGMEAAPPMHPSSIMALHSTERGGRGAQGTNPSRQVVGDVILKGRRHLWGQRNGHYHHGLPAGENTLNAWWARRLLTFTSTVEHYTPELWVQDYIAFMTADPPAHPDTYAESCHRGFFANFAEGKPPLKCGAVTHDTPSMGALVTLAPLALSLLTAHPLQEVQRLCREHVWLTHPDHGLLQVVDSYVTLMANLLQRTGTEDEIVGYFAQAASTIKGTRLPDLLALNRGDSHVVGRVYSLACYITDSWPSVCYLGAKYHAAPGKALLVNTNLGGENAHRGSVLGTLVGLTDGNYDKELYSSLAHHGSINDNIHQWLDRYYPEPTP